MTTATKTYSSKDINKELDGAMDWAEARVHAEFRTDYIGGQPADEPAVEAFAKHHLKITDDTERA
jgi:hypothetical protein